MCYDKFMDEPADFYQLNYGYQFSPKDIRIVEAITWKYSEPLGSYGSSERTYPGDVRNYGIGFGYQRFHWKDLHTSVIPTTFLKQYYEDVKMQRVFSSTYKAS